MAIYSNLVIDQGSTFSADIDVTDSVGDPLDLTGYSVAGQIRKSYASSTAVDFSGSVYSATNGTVRIQLSATQTNAMKAGRYVYDVEIDNVSLTIRIVEGQVEVRPRVTR